jgi:alpha-N-arabinofuranosidase
MRDKTLTVTVVNPHATAARECAIVVRGGEVKNVEATTLSSTDLRAHNSFEQPNALTPRSGVVETWALRGRELVHAFAAASVTRLQLTLA